MPVEESGRAQLFKNSSRADDSRRNRQDMVSKLRKDKRTEQMLKRRQVVEDSENEVTDKDSNAVPPPDPVQIKALIDSSNDINVILGAVQNCRKVLSREQSPPIDEVIDSGLLPKLVQFLLCDDNPALQFEACWALTNIASGTNKHTKAVVECGAVPHFIKLLSSDHVNVCEQAVWALGNVAGDGATYRDFVINCGIIQPLIKLVNPEVSMGFLRNISWTMSNLCRNKDPPPTMETIESLIPTICNLLSYGDKHALSDACWALSYITDGSNDRIQRVITSGIIAKLVELLGHAEVLVVTPALRAVGNIVTGNDEQTQAVISSGALKHFEKLLWHKKNNIQKEAAWTMSNITAGTKHQIQSVIDANLLPYIIDVLSRGDYKTQKEAVWAVTNLTSGGTPEQTLQLVELKALPPLSNMLTVQDPRTVTVALDGIHNILTAANKISEEVCSKVAIMLEECGGLDLIEKLQEHENESIYAKSALIIESFYKGEDGENEELQPQVTNGQYLFNAPTNNTGKISF